jgi:hypothetical protein
MPRRLLGFARRGPPGVYAPPGDDRSARVRAVDNPTAPAGPGTPCGRIRNHALNGRKLRLLLTSLRHQAQRPLQQLAYFLGAGMTPTLSWVQSLHQPRGGSIGYFAENLLLRPVDRPRSSLVGWALVWPWRQL